MTRSQFVFVVSLLVISGCGESTQTRDQCLRTELFQQCLAAVPAGPTQAHYNDWDELVDACDTAAAYQSLRSKKFVKPECRP
jgi:hypothetical protein